jgi:hypothetical protein
MVGDDDMEEMLNIVALAKVKEWKDLSSFEPMSKECWLRLGQRLSRDN